MALVFRGKTACMICGRVLQSDDDICGLPAFISDRSDPLWKYSDSACHTSCYESWEHRRAFETKYAEASEKLERLGQKPISD